MKTQQTFDELTSLFRDYLRQICRREDTIFRYAQLWARIKIFMDTHDMQFYNKQVGETYLSFLFGDTAYSRLKKYYQVIWNSVEALTEFQDTGTVIMGKRRNPSIQLNGPIGAIMEDFVNYKRSIHQIGDLTTYNYRFYLSNYLSFLNNREIDTINQITALINLQFIDTLVQRSMGSRHTVLMIVKGFLKYLFVRDFTPVDHSMSIILKLGQQMELFIQRYISRFIPIAYLYSYEYKLTIVINNKIDSDYEPQYVSEEIHNTPIRKSIAYPGDVVMNIVGPPLNKVAMLTNQFAGWNLNQAITIFRVKEYLDNKFLYYFFCEGTSVKSLGHDLRGVVGQANISLSQCRNFDIPIPPIQEQQEIVRRVESLFAKADAIEQRYQSLKEKTEALPPGILHKAFKGELVPQLPTDGDAKDLLKEMMALKTEAKGKKL